MVGTDATRRPRGCHHHTLKVREDATSPRGAPEEHEGDSPALGLPLRDEREAPSRPCHPPRTHGRPRKGFCQLSLQPDWPCCVGTAPHPSMPDNRDPSDEHARQTLSQNCIREPVTPWSAADAPAAGNEVRASKQKVGFREPAASRVQRPLWRSRGTWTRWLPGSHAPGPGRPPWLRGPMCPDDHSLTLQSGHAAAFAKPPSPSLDVHQTYRDRPESASYRPVSRPRALSEAPFGFTRFDQNAVSRETVRLQPQKGGWLLCSMIPLSSLGYFLGEI